ncbi:hypothetical protein B0H11DRAFT_2262673 [Mycena galericulata]|nr:hypothetical protein B0H11DRAFT_2262673 [Mycena galericulata]
MRVPLPRASIPALRLESHAHTVPSLRLASHPRPREASALHPHRKSIDVSGAAAGLLCGVRMYPHSTSRCPHASGMQRRPLLLASFMGDWKSLGLETKRGVYPVPSADATLEGTKMCAQPIPDASLVSADVANRSHSVGVNPGEHARLPAPATSRASKPQSALAKLQITEIIFASGEDTFLIEPATVVTFVFACVCIECWDTGMTTWALILVLCIGAPLFFLRFVAVPQSAWYVTSLIALSSGMIQAITNRQIVLPTQRSIAAHKHVGSVLTELLVGFLIPGHPVAMMMLKSSLVVRSFTRLCFADIWRSPADLKLGHYMKIPPRS